MVVLEAFQQLWDAAASIAPPNSNPVFFWGTLILAFSILYVAIDKVKQFEDKKWFPAKLVIALIIAYFAASSAFTTVLLAKMFPNFAIVVVAILVFMILAGLLGFNIGGKLAWLVIAIGLWWVFVTTSSTFIDFGTTINVFQGWELIDFVLIGGIILVMIYFIPGAKDAVSGIVKGGSKQ